MTGPQQVLRYLGRYTHRIAISNARIVSIADGHVRFRYRDRRRGNRAGILAVTGPEFARRFLLHVLPKRFVRLRHYGLLANAHRRARLAQVRLCLGAPAGTRPLTAPAESWRELYLRITGREPDRCPACARGTLRIVATLARTRPIIVEPRMMNTTLHLESRAVPIDKRQVLVCEGLLPLRTTMSADRMRFALSTRSRAQCHLGSRCSSRSPDASPHSRPQRRNLHTLRMPRFSPTCRFRRRAGSS